MQRMSLAAEVYRVLAKIPRGRVVTYAKVARAIGRPRAARAVGGALRKNPNLITTPCHRVVRSDGRVGEYAGGQRKKIQLLKQEGVEIKHGRVDLGKYEYMFKIRNPK